MFAVPLLYSTAAPLRWRPARYPASLEWPRARPEFLDARGRVRQIRKIYDNSGEKTGWIGPYVSGDLPGPAARLIGDDWVGPEPCLSQVTAQNAPIHEPVAANST